MRENEISRENKMGTMPVGKLLFTMGAPMMVSMLFQALYNIVDSVFVAMLSQDAMNAVSLAFPLQMLCVAVGGGTGVGVNALLSRSLGEKNQEAADRAANTSFFLAVCSAIVFMLVGLSFGETFFRMQTENAQIVAYGKDYITICLGVSIGVFMQFCTERLLQSTGRTDLAMIPQVTGAITNMILDPIMIFGLFGFPRMEVAGAALATVCGQLLAACIGILLNVKKNHDVHLSLSKMLRPHGATVKEVYRVGVPSIIMQSIGSVMTFGMNRILIGFTEAATAVFGAYFKLQSFIFMPCFGLNNAMVPIVAFNYGAARPDRLKRAVKLTMLAAITIMSLGLLAFETVPHLLLGLFSPTEEMLEIGKTALRVIGLHFPIAGFCIIGGSVFQALGTPVYSLINAICRQIVVLLPAAFLLSLTGRLELVWFAFPIAELMSLLMTSIFLRKTWRNLNAKFGE